MNPSVQRALSSGFAVWVFAAVAMVGYLYKYGQKDIRFGIDLVGGTYITLEVQENDAKRMGVMKIDNDCKIIDFLEKPKKDEDLKRQIGRAHV